MATYYQSLSSQSDNLQNPCPGDQKLASYSELSSQNGNLTVLLSQASAAGPYSEILSGSSLSSHNDTEFQSYEPKNEMVFIPPTSNMINSQYIDRQLNVAGGNLVGNRISVLHGDQNFQLQGLYLSLGTQVQSSASITSFQDHYPTLAFPSFSTHLPAMEKWSLSCEGDEINHSKELRSSKCLSGFVESNHNPNKTEASCNPQSFANHKEMTTDMYAYEPLVYANAILNCKYLKAAQQLLDEVVNIRAALKQPASNKCLDDSKETDAMPTSRSIPSTENETASDASSESIANSSTALSPAERQDLQNKKAKLVSMLDEVDKKYRQYYQQMQILVSTFDMVAGQGAAKSYTALAVQTISRHFRCLHDAISGQIEVTRKSLGEKDASLNGQSGIPRLRYVDHQVRQQRAFRQFGVMRHAWRPQRGLPESSVSVLRAWLFEHFLHPYPNDSEKIMLARQTGLTRNQVANWFINARVRLWKPMVEEMYKEEFGDLEANSKSSLDDAPKVCGENHFASENRVDEFQDTVTSTANDFSQPGQVHDLKPNHIPDSEEKPITRTMFKNPSHGHDITYPGITKFQHDQSTGMDDHSLHVDENIPCDQNGDGCLMPAASTYDASELGGFAVGGQVSLALGLQHHENDGFLMSGGTHVRGNNIAASSVGPDTSDYHCIDPGKQQERWRKHKVSVDS